MNLKTLPIIAVAGAFALVALLFFGSGQDADAQTSTAPTLFVTDSGFATWNYTLPPGAHFVYSEVRWKFYDPSEDLNNWSGRSSQVFYSPDADEYQIPNLTPGVDYKAKVFVGVNQNGSAVYLKSNVVVFPQPEPTPTPTATNTPTATPSSTNTPTPTPTATNTPIPTPTPTNTPTPTPTPTDREALIALYNATDGANWSRKDNWLSNKPIDQWYRVFTNSDGRVTTLLLGGNKLNGTVPPEIGYLGELEVLDIDKNSLSGVLPDDMMNLSSLKNLVFSKNSGLCAPTHSAFQDWLTEVENRSTAPGYVILGPNCVQDREALIALYNATDGANWSRKDNWLSNKPIDQWYRVFTNSDGRVTTLLLGGNKLNGTVPPEIGYLGELEVLDIDKNSLSGVLPDDMMNLSSLKNLVFSKNSGLCAPTHSAFQDWLTEVENRSTAPGYVILGPNCAPTPTPTATPSPNPALDVSHGGLATWNYTLPDGANFIYSEVRWKVYDSSEGINDWSGRSSQVFYSPNVSEYQIPNLTQGTAYKAKVFVGVNQSSGTMYLKSNVVVFR